jgi:hypothetical protein
VKLDLGAHVFYAFGFALKSGCDNSFMELYERCIRFVKNVTTTIPHDQMIKIKVAHLQKS